MASTSGIKDAFYCYVLRSLDPYKVGRTYVGMSNNPAKRLRQHNGDIVGGAAKTQKFRPWEIVVVIGPFYNRTTALQFEWKCQHHPRHTSMRTLQDRLNWIFNVALLDKWTKKCKPLEYSVNFYWLDTSLRMPEYLTRLTINTDNGTALRYRQFNASILI
jgi:predicted GIY-YIG superfamily endonuclease